MAMLPNPLPRLADDPAGTVLGLRLPAGRLVDSTVDGPWHEPLLWQADGPAGPDGLRELTAARSVGLLPVLLEPSEITGLESVSDWELYPGGTSYPGDHDPEEVLALGWSEWVGADQGPAGATGGSQAPGAGELESDPVSAELVAPFGTAFPGLAPALLAPADAAAGRPDEVAEELTAQLMAAGHFAGARAALVYARRSADIPAAIGWTGPANHESDVAVLSAVLRSWEDRFGLRVVALGFDTLTCVVAAPPATIEEAEAIAAEHLSFCSDALTQNGPGTLRDYAKSLLNEPVWRFWWD